MIIKPSVSIADTSTYTAKNYIINPSVTKAPGSETKLSVDQQLSSAPSKGYTPLPDVPHNNSTVSIALPFRNSPGTSSANQSMGNQVSVSRNGFLWKPVSESDGKLVVLLPQSLTGKIKSASVYSSLPPQANNLIESGRFAGDDKNENRAHFRFAKPGSSYPDNAYVVAQLHDGTYASFQIKDSSSRNN